jgi:hypothetical protein
VASHAGGTAAGGFGVGSAGGFGVGSAAGACGLRGARVVAVAGLITASCHASLYALAAALSDFFEDLVGT